MGRSIVQTILPLLFFCFPLIATGQLNAYAEIDGIAGPASVNLDNVDEGDDSFEDGENVIVMQMQDDVIGGNTGDNADFGDIANIASAGLWEVRKIQSHTEFGGIPVSVTFHNPLNNVYNIGANSRVQLISFPKLGSPDYTMTADHSAQDWDGTTGGVLAFQVPGILTLESNIDADGAGFRGGNADSWTSGGCQDWTYVAPSGDQFGDKGEGIHRSAAGWMQAARGKIANGGGGGNEHNAGGGGGGNYAAGGEGGTGWDCEWWNTPGGLGGVGLSANISSLRFFMGGGGGGGEGNDNLSTDGGDGGGIIIIKADEIHTSSSCGGVSITANGENAADPGNDGSGGGGAGGTVHFKVNDWDLDPSCPLQIEANGGNGGDIGSPDAHGGGGGGGQGSIIQAGSNPTNNVDQDTESGDGGENCDGCGTAGSGGGNNDDGVSSGGGGGPLPIELVSFDAHENGSRVKLSWKTMTETDNDRFELYRSKAGKEWERFKTVDGAGDSQDPISYRAFDESPYEGTSYYRLEQVDFDGKRSKYGPIAVRFERKRPLSVHPNPTKGRLFIEHSEPIEGIRVHTPRGERIRVPISLNGTDAMLSASELPPGVYFLEVQTIEELIRKRFVKR